MQGDRIPLCVPWWDERDALTKGAQYSAEDGFTVAADAFLDDFWEWLPRMYRVRPGEAALLPDMLPVTTWEQNVRHLLGGEAWDKMRKHAYKAAGFRCEVCGAKGKLEAHERFDLVNETAVQRLVAIESLCPLCHKAKHLGIARRLGMLDAVKRHMLYVNRWTPAQLEAAIEDAYEMWEQRAYWEWTVDLDFVRKAGLLYA